jgi:hypothetical protein
LRPSIVTIAVGLGRRRLGVMTTTNEPVEAGIGSANEPSRQEA